MDKDRIKGSVEQAKGVVKEAVGKATGDAKLDVEGRNEKAAGKVQNAAGGVRGCNAELVKEIMAQPACDEQPSSSVRPEAGDIK